MNDIFKNILGVIKSKIDTLDNNNKKILFGTIGLFIVSKILLLFNIHIPGLNILPVTILSFFIGVNLLIKYKKSVKDNIKSKAYTLIGFILVSISSFIFFCLALIYPFIIFGSIVL